MLAATQTVRPSLADVLRSSFDSVAGRFNALGLPTVDRVVVVIVDGLGAVNLRARAGHARTLASALTRSSTIQTVFPTTTVAALASLTTGEQPGVHGMVGYEVLDAEHDRVVKLLTGWDEKLDPLTWQRSRTLFEEAAANGVPSFTIGSERFRGSGFSQAVLRGAGYLSGVSIADRFTEARRVLDANDTAVVYLYISELDQAAHRDGWQSERWLRALEATDAAAAEFLATLGPREGMLVTADHGVIDVPQHAHVLFDSVPGLVDGIRHVAGEPRGLQLYFEPDASTDQRQRVLERWRSAEGDRSWVLTRDEIVAQGWLGADVADEVLPRVGDIVVAARKAVVYYDSRTASETALAMVGQHGSRSPEETTVPLLRFGAFAR